MDNSQPASEGQISETTDAGQLSEVGRPVEATTTDDGPTVRTESHDPDFPRRLLEFMKTGWREPTLAVAARPEAPHYSKRREAVSAAFPGETVVIPTGRDKVRANDMDHPFRPGSDFAYLTGDYAPESVLFLRPNGSGHDATLFLRPRTDFDSDEFFRSRTGALWVGARASLAERSAELGIETASLDGLAQALDECAPGRTRVLRGFDPMVDAAIRPADDGTRDGELASTIAELKLVKDEWEVAQLQEAIDLTVLGFEDVARALPADRSVSERLIEGIFGLRARHDGNATGYPSIVGAGPHATILHWTRNDGRTRPGDVLLMDMGVENRHLYTSDITRTVPVSGTFSPMQRQIYDIVYAAQQAGIAAVRPGVKYTDVDMAVARVQVEGLAGLGLLPVSVDEALERTCGVHRRWTLHGFGHMLGIDVHDCARARREMYREGVLGEGYVLTVEPGLYFQPDDELAPAELRGLGIRIEDDILVTADGAVNLSAGLPRHAADVESWLAAQRAAGHRLPG